MLASRKAEQDAAADAATTRAASKPGVSGMQRVTTANFATSSPINIPGRSKTANAISPILGNSGPVMALQQESLIGSVMAKQRQLMRVPPRPKNGNITYNNDII